MDQLVSFFIRIHRGESLALQSKDLAAMGPRRDLNFGFPVNGWHFNLGSEYRIGKRKIELKSHVQSISMQVLVLLFFDQNDQIPCRAASFAGIASSTNT